MAEKQGFAHRLYTGQLSYDFIRHRRLWFTISAVAMLVCIVALIWPGLRLGIEFRGGTDFQAPVQVTSTTVDEVRQAVDSFEVDNLEAQVFSLGSDAVRVQTRSLTPEETTSVRSALAEAVGTDAESVTYNAIGASWGQQISQQAAIALVVFIVLVMVLIAVWFRDWKMSVAAIIALAHDVLLTLGVYALAGFTVTPATLIGLLTILGYSLYDTVVVFDKIRENITGLENSGKTYSQQANLALNQVLIRSLNTTVIGVLPVGALLVGGLTLASGPLQDLGLVLFIGMIAGAYSSLVIATPLLTLLKEREPAMVEHRARLERGDDVDEVDERPEPSNARGATAVVIGEDGASKPVAVAPVPQSQRNVRRTQSTRAERKKK